MCRTSKTSLQCFKKNFIDKVKFIETLDFLTLAVFVCLLDFNDFLYIQLNKV